MYSDIFNTYKTENGINFYNILKKIELPSDKTTDLYRSMTVPHTMPWTSLAYKVYGDLTLYWIFFAANTDKKLNPLFASVGDIIFYVNPAYIDDIISGMSSDNI